MTETAERSKVGDVVKYRDEHGVDHNALVNAVHGPACINVTYVGNDETKRDSWGVQIERASSVQKQSEVTAHGRYYNTV